MKEKLIILMPKFELFSIEKELKFRPLNSGWISALENIIF